MDRLLQKKDLRRRVSAQKLEENPMVKNSSWHHILKHERQLRGWSQADVAARVGSDPKSVSRWERSLAFPSPYFQQRLVDLFGKDAQALGFIADQKENFRDTPEASDGRPSQRAWKGTLQNDHIGEGPVTVRWPPNPANEPYYPLPGRERDQHHLLAALQGSQGTLVITLDRLSELGKATENADALVTHLRNCSPVLLILLC